MTTHPTSKVYRSEQYNCKMNELMFQQPGVKGMSSLRSLIPCNKYHVILILGHSKSITCFSSPSDKKLMRAGGKMVVNITSIMGNGRQYQVFKNRSGILL